MAGRHDLQNLKLRWQFLQRLTPREFVLRSTTASDDVFLEAKLLSIPAVMIFNSSGSYHSLLMVVRHGSNAKDETRLTEL